LREVGEEDEESEESEAGKKKNIIIVIFTMLTPHPRVLEYTSFAGITNLPFSAPTNLHPDCIALSCLVFGGMFG